MPLGWCHPCLVMSIPAEAFHTWQCSKPASHQWRVGSVSSSSSFWSLLSPMSNLGCVGCTVVKNPPANAGYIRDVGSIPGLGRSLGGGHGDPLQYPCLENPMDRAAWWAAVHKFTKSQTQLKWLNTHTCIHICTYIHIYLYNQITLFFWIWLSLKIVS